ncbi:MAG: peptidoglycan editing factor PgeF [Armatimonadetes bacterium]|nr:peptidoglycan editing factor PgeF [Armatimonadota bacterium]
MTRKTVGSTPIWQFGILSGCGSLCHGITGRQRGVSEGPYAQLNLGLHVGDDAEHVVENRRRVCEALGVEFETCTFGQQMHGDALRLVSPGDAGAGRTRFEDGFAETDGLIVREPGITIGVFVADCVPLVFYDPETHVGAVVHAGWRGTAAGIAAKAVRFLAEECSARPETLLVGIGPAIGRCCFQVSEEVARAVGEAARSEEVAEVRDGSWYADVAEANRRQLLAAGVKQENIELSGVCTSCHADEFYSERKLGRPTGRFGAFLSLRER